MGKTVQITCDACGHDLTTTSNTVDYRLVLGVENKPGYGTGAYTDMMISPPIDRTFYFCGIQCLDHWRNRERHEDNLWKAWWDKWKEERGTKREDGFIYSYPSPPREMTAAAGAEFKVAALVAFPMKFVEE